MSFLTLILAGTIGFKTLPGLYTAEPLGWLDALFMATSAVCVTGLTVVDTATFLTFRGHAFLLLLIQLGGLGIITFTSLIIVSLGRRLSLRQEALTPRLVGTQPEHRSKNLTRNVVVFTFAIELIGAGLLYLAWAPRFGWSGALWPAIFHSVSAFCNAGFSTFSDSLIGLQQTPVSLLIIASLFVIGGIGFLTLEELVLLRKSKKQQRQFRLSLHTRIVIATTIVLLVSGWTFFTTFEWSGALNGLPAWAKILNGLFMSATARTAGFNAIDYGMATDRSNFLTILLMFVGGSPGSTAGGIKTTTLALIVLLAWSRLRGYPTVNLWGRSIPNETIQRAVGLMVFAFALVTAATFILTTSEATATGGHEGGGRFLHLMFESVSAFGTVGLSMGITTGLTTVGKWTVIVLMFLGRVGPMTFAAALSRRRLPVEGAIRYAHEEVDIG